jgi:hypothetical protein
VGGTPPAIAAAPATLAAIASGTRQHHGRQSQSHLPRPSPVPA